MALTYSIAEVRLDLEAALKRELADAARFFGATPDETNVPPCHEVTMRLTDVSVEVANAIRRCLMEEIPTTRLHVDIEDIVTDDPYILSDFLVSRLACMPIYPNPDPKVLEKARLDCRNTTHIIQNVTTTNITGHKALGLDAGLDLVHLRPGKRLTITRFTTKKQAGYVSAAHNLVIVRYKAEPETETQPQSFTITYKTNGEVEPLYPLRACLANLTERCRSAKKIIAETPEPKSAGAEFYVSLSEEYWTLSRLIARACYQKDPNLQFVCPGIVHPSSTGAHVRLIHAEPKALMLDAVAAIIRLFESMMPK